MHNPQKEQWRIISRRRDYYQATHPPGGDGEKVRVHPGGAAEEPCDAGGDGGGVDGVQRHHDEGHHQVGEEHGEQEQVELHEGEGMVCRSVLLSRCHKMQTI